MKVARYVIVPDLQIPHHDRGFVNNILNYVKDRPPDGIVFIGDNVDCTAPSSWSKGTAEEFAGTLQNEFDEWFGVAYNLRDIYSGWVGTHYGNHEKRINTYLKTKAPALASLRELELEKLMSLNKLEIEPLPDHYDIAPGWVTHHGDFASLSDIAGRTASNYAAKIGKSVIIGHTHRAGIVAESYGYNSRLTTRFGVEVGHAMQEDKAHYTNGVMNWQKAFGELFVFQNEERTFPRVNYAARDGSFYVEGKLYD